jgi:outer membrane lipoprotein-sorting protein
MQRLAGWVLAACLASGAWAAEPVAAPDLSAAQIVENNAVARGGVGAWRKIETMAWAGQVESANAPGRNLPFLLEQKRPNKTRFEIMAASQRSVRIFDGTGGWKLRPSSSGRPELQPYAAEELNFAREAPVIDGPLMDAVAKDAAVTLGGIDEIDGRKAYRLNVRLRSGENRRVWVDAQTFLESRFDRETRNAQGQPGVVSVAYRNYHTFEGLQLPLTIETGAGTGKPVDKLVIDKVALNPQLEDRMFARPNLPVSRRKGVIVDTRSAAVPPAPRPASPAQ